MPSQKWNSTKNVWSNISTLSLTHKHEHEHGYGHVEVSVLKTEYGFFFLKESITKLGHINRNRKEECIEYDTGGQYMLVIH